MINKVFFHYKNVRITIIDTKLLLEFLGTAQGRSQVFIGGGGQLGPYKFVKKVFGKNFKSIKHLKILKLFKKF